MPGSAVFFLQNAFLCHEFVLICHNKKTYFCIISKVCFGFFFVCYICHKCDTTCTLFQRECSLPPPRNKKGHCSLSINIL